MSAAPTPKTYENIKITDPSGAVWVSPSEGYEEELENAKKRLDFPTYIILIGPTGSGKSTFIETIASKSTREPLDIAKDQLESVTQQPCLYEIKNLQDTTDGDPIYIIDTPGFADPKISELDILEKMTFWRDKSQLNQGWIRLLYFHPITDIRMPGSRKRCLDMIRRFWGLRLSQKAMLVMSMWDRIPERSRNAAEIRLAQLSASHWGDWITEGSSVVKFENTFDSAMDILNMVVTGKARRDGYPDVSGLGMEGTDGNPIYEALMSRLSSLEQQRATLLEDLSLPETQRQPELISILTNELAKTETLCEKFTIEMEDFRKRFEPLDEIHTSAAMGSNNAAPATTNAIGSDPNQSSLIDSGAHNVVDAATATYVADSVTPPMDVIHTTSNDDVGPDCNRIVEAGGQQHAASFPKRIGRWIYQKIDKLNFNSSSQKGA